MSKIYVTEFAELQGQRAGFAYPIPSKPLRTQVIAFNNGSQQLQPFMPETKFIRVCADGPCCIEIDPNPVANVNSSMLLCANVHEYLGVNYQDRLAVIASA